MPKIDEIYAYICDDKGPGDEGIIGMMNGNTFMPLVGADVARSKSIRKAAEDIARATGKKVKLVKFSTRTVLEEDIS